MCAVEEPQAPPPFMKGRLRCLSGEQLNFLLPFLLSLPLPHPKEFSNEKGENQESGGSSIRGGKLPSRLPQLSGTSLIPDSDLITGHSATQGSPAGLLLSGYSRSPVESDGSAHSHQGHTPDTCLSPSSPQAFRRWLLPFSVY